MAAEQILQMKRPYVTPSTSHFHKGIFRVFLIDAFLSKTRKEGKFVGKLGLVMADTVDSFGYVEPYRTTLERITDGLGGKGP